jgi:hypothetical protein
MVDERYLKKRVIVVYEALCDRLSLLLREHYGNSPSDREIDDAHLDARDIVHDFLL